MDHETVQCDSVMTIPFHPLFQSVHLIYGSGHYTWLLTVTLHRVSFTTACLTIGKDTDIKAIKGALNEQLGVFKYTFLAIELTEATIESDLLLLLECAQSLSRTSFISEFKLDSEVIYLFDYLFRLPVFFLSAEWSYPAEHTDLALQIFNDVMEFLSLQDF